MFSTMEITTNSPPLRIDSKRLRQTLNTLLYNVARAGAGLGDVVTIEPPLYPEKKLSQGESV